jgi:hypothetical protein
VTMPYRSHSLIDELRVRRKVRKQARLDKRIMKRAEQRFNREQGVESLKHAALIALALGLMALETFGAISLYP